MPVFPLTAAYVCGILGSRILASPPVATGMLITGLLLSAWFILRGTPWQRIPVWTACFLLGLLLAGQAARPPGSDKDITRFLDMGPLVLEGRMHRLVVREDGRSRFDLQVSEVRTPAGRTAASGWVRVAIGAGKVAAGEGQTVRLRTRLRRPRNFGVPGEFDYRGFLAAQRIFATAYLPEASWVVPLADPSRTGPSPLQRFRSRVAAAIEQAVPAAEAPLVKALVIGMRGGVTQDQRSLLSEGGVSHLFAISGLHFGMLGLLLYLAGRWLYSRSTRLLLFCPPRRILPLLLLLPLSGYLFLTGGSLPTRRAFFMTAAASLLYSGNRRTHPLCLLCSAALLLLLLEPLALYQPAFQLSFAGLFGILLWLPTWQKPLLLRPHWQRWPATLFLASLAATLATAPLTLWHFHILAPAGLVTNLLATPLLAWGAVPAGLCGVLVLPCLPEAAATCFAAAGALVALALEIVATLAHLPCLEAIRHFPSLGELAGLVLLLAGVAVWGKDFRRRVWCGMLLLAGIACWLHQPGPVPQLEVAALSVGQGDATLLTLDRRFHYLIDGGGLPGSRFDPGERLVAPALGRFGVKRLDGVILTHDHPDHRDGLLFILRNFAVDRFYSGQSYAELNPELRNVLETRGIPQTTLTRGWHTFSPGSTGALQVFVPHQTAVDLNERSLAVYAGLGEDGVLLTADLGPKGLQQLFRAGLPGQVSLFKIPHHGSRHSAPAAALASCKPAIAFVSVGRDNVYRLPHPDVVAACESAGVPLLRTDREGSLVFRSTGYGWQTATAAAGLFR